MQSVSHPNGPGLLLASPWSNRRRTKIGGDFISSQKKAFLASYILSN